MKKILGLAAFLLVLYLALLVADEGARTVQNHVNLARRIGGFGIISLGAGILIISGGIDLSIGSVVGLSATVLAVLLTGPVQFAGFLPPVQFHPLSAILITLAMGVGIGLIHGLFVTRLKVQAFVVTLCGLFIYRSVARWIAGDQVQGLGTDFATLKYVLAQNQVVLGIPVFLVIFILLAAAATVFLHFSTYGRYLYAIGSNERAAEYSGIATDRYRLLAYVISSVCATVWGMLFLLEQNSAQPSQAGSFFELYAIAGAVLGGCSLRGGEGTVLGIAIGTAILWMLPNFTVMWGVPSSLQEAIIGGALLVGAIMDELLRRRGQRQGKR